MGSSRYDDEGTWIEAIVPLEAVDWRETLRNRLHYPHEWEVTLRPGASVGRVGTFQIGCDGFNPSHPILMFPESRIFEDLGGESVRFVRARAIHHARRSIGPGRRARVSV